MVRLWSRLGLQVARHAASRAYFNEISLLQTIQVAILNRLWGQNIVQGATLHDILFRQTMQVATLNGLRLRNTMQVATLSDVLFRQIIQLATLNDVWFPNTVQEGSRCHLWVSSKLAEIHCVACAHPEE